MPIESTTRTYLTAPGTDCQESTQLVVTVEGDDVFLHTATINHSSPVTSTETLKLVGHVSRQALVDALEKPRMREYVTAIAASA